MIDDTGKILQTANSVFIVFNVKGISKGKYYVQFEMENGDQVRKRFIINELELI